MLVCTGWQRYKDIEGRGLNEGPQYYYELALYTVLSAMRVNKDGLVY